MKDKIVRTITLLMLLLSVSSCSLVATIFKGGMGAGVIIVFVLLAVLIYAISKILGNKK